MLADLPIRTFLDELAAGTAAPGGGAIAALQGAQGAALAAMVCNLTIGRKKYAAVEARMLEIREQVDALRAQLTDLVDRDASAYDGVMAAYKLPKETEAEKQARHAAVQEGLKQATQVPLEIMAACVALLELCSDAITLGNPNVVSDGAAGVIAARAGMQTAAVNVRINLNAIHDQAFVAASSADMSALLERGEAAHQRVWAIAAERLGM